MDTRGYARLNASLLISALLLLSVLTYQWSAHRTLTTVKAPGDPKTAESLYTAVQLFPQTIPSLQAGFYELQIEDRSGKTHAVSRFRITESRQIIDSGGSAISNGLFLLPQGVFTATSAAIAVTSGSGAALEFLSGAFEGDRATLSFAAADFSGAGGQYMLGTPTDGNDNINERSGVWFGNYETGVSTLVLPALQRGWVYEGWAVVDGRPLTTGRFTNAMTPDLFSGFNDTRQVAPRIPGEDFLLNPPVAVFAGLTFPTDLAGQVVRVSIEPDMNGIDPTGQAPLGIVALEAEVPKRAEPHTLYKMDLRAKDFPKATIVLR